MTLKYMPVTFVPGRTTDLFNSNTSRYSNTGMQVIIPDSYTLEIPEAHIRICYLDQHETIPEKRYTIPCNNVPYLGTPAETMNLNWGFPAVLWDIHESMYTPSKVYTFPSKYLVHPDVPPNTFLLEGLFYMVPQKKN